MLDSFQTQWRGLRHGKPGHRFRSAYENARKKKPPLWHRILQLLLALVIFGVGVVFAFIPGPAVVFFALAGALLAAESRSVAVLLDWVEVKLRALGRWAKRHWDRFGLVGRTLVVLVGGTVSLVMASLTAWVIFFR